MTKPGQARSQTPAPQAQATKPRRIGLYGGAFDPPHLAHVALAQAAVQQLGLERIYITPTGQPWMKHRQLTPPAHRLHMAQAAFASIPQAVVDDCELRRSGTTYTIDTLRALRQECPDARLLLIIGADQAEALHTWKDSAEIAKIAVLSIAARARPVPGAPPADISHLPPSFYEPIDLPPISLSSTEVRSLAAAGQPIDHLVPAAVARYIAEHHLYQS